MSKTQRQRQAENIIEAEFPLPSNITCDGLVDTSALMNAERTLLANEVLLEKGKDRKMVEAKITALSQRRKELDELYVMKRCRELEALDIEKEQLDILNNLRAQDKSMPTQTFDNRTLFGLGLITLLALGGAYALRQRG
jgi:hypothetical protein